MPTVTEATVSGWAHCEDSMCDGNTQQPVSVVRVLTQYTYLDSGGDLPGVEKSFEHFVFADDKDQACPHCGKQRACSVQERPVYPTSQYAQDGLLKLIKEGMVKPLGEITQARDDTVAELREQLAAQQAQIAQLLSARVEEQPEPAKRGPGRPRKSEPEGDAA